MSDLLEEIFPFSPASFLHVAVEIEPYKGFAKNPYKKPFLLPNMDAILDEDSFAEVALSYCREGIFLSVLVNKPFENVVFPAVAEGDSFECFVDTRDVKTAGSIHKFCHHFVFFPKEIGDKKGCELTKFRGDDAHPLCNPSLLSVETTFKKNSYEMLICIDKEALYGFDPVSFNRLGFTYRINRAGGDPQHFNLSSEDYAIEKYPSLWASLKLKPETIS